MSRKKQKLELTWIGKDERPKLEPRILIEDPDLSYHAKERHSDDDIFDNMLIHGDNLLALKALEADYTGKVKCIYIDPPFNTGNAFEHYDDGLEHSIWLSLIKERIEILKALLSEDGVLMMHLDGSEIAYATILLDEVFGRKNHLNTISLTTNDPSGFKATSSTIFSTVNYIIIHAKDRFKCNLNKLYTPKRYDEGYSKVLLNPQGDFKSWRFDSIRNVVAKQLGFLDGKEAKKNFKGDFENEIALFAVLNPKQVFQSVAIGGGAKIKRKETIEVSKQNKGEVFVHPNEDVEGFYILNGRQIVFYDNRFVEIDGKSQPGQLITDVWTDISWNGIASEGSVEFKNGKKPEKLIKRCIELATNPGDLVVDSFGGSGTTGAVAHKMNRRWIMIELGDHCNSHVVPRLKRLIDGVDTSGVSSSLDWQGGGGFRYYHLAPSLLEKDKYGNWIISQKYNATMLAEAMCKNMGFTYDPSQDQNEYWRHGHSTETDFIFVTATSMTHAALKKLSEDVGPGRTLFVCCKAFNANTDAFDNLTIKKIPQAVLTKCEWGQDDYSLNVENLPMAKSEAEKEQEKMRETLPLFFGQDDAKGEA